MTREEAARALWAMEHFPDVFKAYASGERIQSRTYGDLVWYDVFDCALFVERNEYRRKPVLKERWLVCYGPTEYKFRSKEQAEAFIQVHPGFTLHHMKEVE